MWNSLKYLPFAAVTSNIVQKALPSALAGADFQKLKGLSDLFLSEFPSVSNC